MVDPNDYVPGPPDMAVEFTTLWDTYDLMMGKVLDWLAAEFMNPQYDAAGTHPWDVRHMVRTVVLSDTYRQSSISSPELDKQDPDNRLLARQSRFRVDAVLLE